MQEEKLYKNDFLDRTDALAKKLGKQLNDLPELLDCSRSSVFAWRRDPENVTKKAWRKLQEAERKAGIVRSNHPAPYNSAGEPPLRVSEDAMIDLSKDDEQPTPQPGLSLDYRVQQLEQTILSLQATVLRLQNLIIEKSEKSD